MEASHLSPTALRIAAIPENVATLSGGSSLGPSDIKQNNAASFGVPQSALNTSAAPSLYPTPVPSLYPTPVPSLYPTPVPSVSAGAIPPLSWNNAQGSASSSSQSTSPLNLPKPQPIPKPRKQKNTTMLVDIQESCAISSNISLGDPGLELSKASGFGAAEHNDKVPAQQCYKDALSGALKDKKAARREYRKMRQDVQMKAEPIVNCDPVNEEKKLNHRKGLEEEGKAMLWSLKVNAFL